MMETAADMRYNGDGGFWTLAMAYTNNGNDGRGRDAVIEGHQDERYGSRCTW